MIANNYDDLSEWSPESLMNEEYKITFELFDEKSLQLHGADNSALINEFAEKRSHLRNEILTRLNRDALKEEDEKKEGNKKDNWLNSLFPVGEEEQEEIQAAMQRGDPGPLGERLRKLRESVEGELIRT